ncbi:hypothetical protein [Dongia sp.]|uniref:hypothetical protein n=1 Tax=Dongia sp. TaxID=1977262 RepID=UPI0035B2AD18
MRRFAIVSLLAFSLSAPATAQDTEDAERLAEQGLAKILQALDLLMKTIPQYAAPEVRPNGDIIIRRLHPEDEPPRKPRKEDDEPSDGTDT